MGNEIILIILGVAILAGIATLIYFTVTGKKDNSSSSDILKMQLEITNMLNNRMNEIKDLQSKNQTDSMKMMMENQEKSLRQMGELQKQMAEISMVQKSLENVSTNVVKLNDILSNNQTRGKFGEIQLEMLLGSIFGETNRGYLFDTQFNLDSGSGLRPDAVIFLDGNERKQTVCVDSKFSLAGADDLFDSSKRLTEAEVEIKSNELKNALKIRINETSKYIVRGRTIEYAVMFIPSDAIFIYVDSRMREIIEYAFSKHVVVSCPATLPPLLNSFKVLQKDIQKTKDIEKTLDLMRKFEDNFRRFDERWATVNKDIAKLYKDTEDLNITVGKIDNEFKEIAEGKTQRLESFDSFQ